MKISASSQQIKLYLKASTSPLAKPIKINCLGDSITYGIGSSLTPETPLKNLMPYHAYWQKQYQAVVRNYGQCGSFVADYTDRSKGVQPNHSLAFVRRCMDMEPDADMITVLGGVNDCQAGYFTPHEFGSFTPSTACNAGTFCGALHVMLTALRQKYPHALIVYLTPLVYGDKKDGRNTIWEHSDKLLFYIQAIKHICAEYAVQVIDLYTPPELHFCINSDDKSICGDRLHFGHLAHAALGKYIIKQLALSGAVTICD